MPFIPMVPGRESVKWCRHGKYVENGIRNKKNIYVKNIKKWEEKGKKFYLCPVRKRKRREEKGRRYRRSRKRKTVEERGKSEKR